MKRLILTVLFALYVGISFCQVVPKTTIIDTTANGNQWTYVNMGIKEVHMSDSVRLVNNKPVIEPGYFSTRFAYVVFRVKKTRIVIGDTIITFEDYKVPATKGGLKLWNLYNDASVIKNLKKQIKQTSLPKRLNQK